jgi:hypothetical protein
MRNDRTAQRVGVLVLGGDGIGRGVALARGHQTAG